MILIVLGSCKEDDFHPDLAVRGEWVLVKSEGSWTGAVQEDEELGWHETYVPDRL